MLFGLNKLGLTSDSFMLLHQIIEDAYYDKMVETTIGYLENATGLSKYKVRACLNELRRRKLIQTSSFTSGTRITLMPVLVEMIAKDYRRKEVSQKTKVMNEIKKLPGRKKPEPCSTKNSRTSSTQTSTRKPRPIISGHSLKNTSTATETIAPPKQTPRKKTNTPLKQTPRNPTATKKNPAGLVEKKPYVTTRGKLYTYFEHWLHTNEGLSRLDVDRLLRNEAEMEAYWLNYRKYAGQWLRLQKMRERPDPDLNKIKFMRQVARAA
jgi:hypothetical protein